MKDNKYLTVAELIEILKQYDDDKCVIVTKDGKGHDFALSKENIELESSAYFGNCGIGDSFKVIKKELLLHEYSALCEKYKEVELYLETLKYCYYVPEMEYVKLKDNISEENEYVLMEIFQGEMPFLRIARV